MLKSALRDMIATELDDPTNTEVLTLLSNFIDEVISDIATRFNWDLLTVLKEETLLIASSSISVLNVVNIENIQRRDTDEEIPLIRRGTLVGHNWDLEQTGPPNYAFIAGFDQATQAYVIQFDQIADVDYLLYVSCKKNLGPIADSEHVPFPSDLLYLIKLGVRNLFYLHEDNINLAGSYERRYEKGIKEYLATHSQMIANRVISPGNSDLSFAGTSGSYDWNLDKDRVIVES